MEITYIGTFALTDDQYRKLEAIITSACAYSGYNYSVEIRNFPDFEIISIKIYPPEANHYVSFHNFDLQNMGKILGMRFAFCDLFNGGLELTFMI